MSSNDESAFRLLVKQRLREMRHLYGLTQKELAEYCNVESQTYNAWERTGMRCLPNAWKLREIAYGIYGVSLKSFVSEQVSSADRLLVRESLQTQRTSEKDFRVFIKRRLRRVRVLADISKQDFASSIGKSYSSYNAWELRSCDAIPSLYMLVKISQEIYHIPIDDFVNEKITSENLYGRYISKG